MICGNALIAAMVNASAAGDVSLNASLYQSLRAYFEVEGEEGRSHPFLTETLADVTENRVEAVRLYKLAISQVPSVEGEPLHTKMVCLGRRLLELGRKEEAEAYLRDGRAEAVRCSDNYYIKQADEMLRELNG